MSNRRHRLTAIVRVLQDQNAATLTELAQKLSVSEMTIRRDLDFLAAEGQVERTHGGATIAEKIEFEFNFGARRKANQRYKQAIARVALQYNKPGQKLIFDTGTTALELAYLIKDFKDLTVLTTSLAVASVLQFSPGIEAILLGGTIRRGIP